MAIDESRVQPDVEPQIGSSALEHHATVKEQIGDLFQDLSSEVKLEMAEIRAHEEPTKSTRADLFVRQHVMGLILILFGLVALILLIGIAAIAIFGSGRHHGHFYGIF